MLKIIICSFLMLASVNANALDNHKDDHGKDHRDDHGKDHNKVPKEEIHSDHDDEHVEDAKLDGFKLNTSAMKTFEIKMIKFTHEKILVSKDAIFKGLSEVNLYRFRDGLFKRIDFKTLSQSKNDYLISSPDLKTGDQIVVNGIGFLRIAEIAASGGLSDSHSH